MEWGGLLIQALMLGGFLCWESFFKQKGKNLAIKDDARDISYEQEKGKNLATKDDIVKITNLIETVKSEVSFESQRKHTYIEQRTNRFIEILHLAEELQLYQSQLLYYLYDNYSADKLSLLIDNSNKTLLKLIHEYRILMVSIDDEIIIDSIDNLRNSSGQYVAFMCYIASNAINHLTTWKINFDLAILKENNIVYVKLAMDNMGLLIKTRKEFEAGIKIKEEKLDNDIMSYLSVLEKLFKKEFYLKENISDLKTTKPNIEI